MRSAVLVSVTLALTLSFAVGAVGQQEILLVDLRVEPDRMERSITLFDAAVANDFATFDAVYREAPQPEYAELHRLWTWSMNDRVGAFYDSATYERLARLYPGFRNYIADYSVVDSHGNTFYPTAETRRFLLRQAVYGTVARTDTATAAPKKSAPVVASAKPAATVAASAPAPVPAAKVAVTRTAVEAQQRAPKVVEVAPPVVHRAPLATAPVVAPSPSRVVTPSVIAEETVRGVTRRNEASRGSISRSIFLIIAGLIGIGMMTLMLQAPRDEQPAPKSAR